MTARTKKPEIRRTTIDFDANVYEQVKQIADSQERDFGKQIRFIVNEWLEQYRRIEEGKKVKQ